MYLINGPRQPVPTGGRRPSSWYTGTSLKMSDRAELRTQPSCPHDPKPGADPPFNFKRFTFVVFYAVLCVFIGLYIYMFKDDAKMADQNVRVALKSKAIAPGYSGPYSDGHPHETQLGSKKSVQPAPTCFYTRTVVSDPWSVYGQHLSQKNASEIESLSDIFDIPSGQHMIVDLSHSYSCKAFYHRLVDCFIPSLCAFLHGVDQPPSTFIVPSYLLPIYGYFLVNSEHTLIPHNGKGGPNSFGLRLPPNETMTVVYPYWNGKADNLTRDFQSLKNHFAESLTHETSQDVASLPSPFHVTLVHRHCTENTGSRCFKDSDDMLLQFTKGLGMPGKVYYGNESFEDTVKLFAGSKVVVGYHGAGLVNTLFCPSDAVVLEYTTFHDMNATRMWRSNAGIAGLHGSLRWLKYPLDIDRLTSLSDLANHTDTNHYIKSLRWVDVTGATLYNSIERVKEALVQTSSQP